MKPVDPKLSYRNKRYHGWLAGLRNRGETKTNQELVEICEDNAEQWGYNLEKVRKEKTEIKYNSGLLYKKN